METPAQQPKKVKITWHFVAYITLMIVAQKALGIGGTVGAFIIAYGVHKVYLNPVYSKLKKTVYSILIFLGGAIVALLISGSLLFTLRHFFPTLGKQTNVEDGYQVPAGYSTYKNENMEISAMAYPTGWLAIDGKDEEYHTNIRALDKVGNVDINLIVLEGQDVMDYATYASSVEAQAKEIPNINFQITKQEVRKVNGNDWLIFDSVISASGVETVYYNRTAIFKTGDGNGKQYYQILMESDKDHFEADAKSLDVMLESFRRFK